MGQVSLIPQYKKIYFVPLEVISISDENLIQRDKSFILEEPKEVFFFNFIY